MFQLHDSRMKKLYSLAAYSLLALALLTPTARADEPAAYAIADATSGHVLASSNLEKKLQIGSLTKIATAMVVLDWIEAEKQDVGSLATVPTSALSIGGANPVGFQPGDRVSLRDLLYAALLQSDNVAAYTLADYVGNALFQGEANLSPVDLFVAHMNALALKLNMKRTRFLNPHGLDNLERPFSTAKDLILLSDYALNRSSFRFYVAQKQRQITRILPDGTTAAYNLVNTNELLGIKGIDGVKTGKTGLAGECVIISAERKPEIFKHEDGAVTVTPRRLVVILLGSESRFATASGLLERGWDLYDRWAAAGRPIKER